MRVLLQRVSEASVEVGQETVGRIGRGVLLFVGVAPTDDETVAHKLAGKCVKLRIFSGEDGKSHQHSALDLGLEILAVSQFTLYGNTDKGRRPGFDRCAEPEHAELLYQKFLCFLRESGLRVESGRFRESMQVRLVNDGPVTYLLEKETQTQD